MITEDTHSIKGVFTHAVKTLKSDLKNVKGAGLTAGLFKVVWCLYLSDQNWISLTFVFQVNQRTPGLLQPAGRSVECVLSPSAFL